MWAADANWANHALTWELRNSKIIDRECESSALQIATIVSSIGVTSEITHKDTVFFSDSCGSCV